MKRIFALTALLLCAVAIAAGQALAAGNVSIASSATDVTCGGTATVTVTLQTVAPPPEDAPLDIVIAIDESGSLSSTQFNLEKQAATAFVNALEFSGTLRRVAVYAFSFDARRIVALTPNKTTALNAINSIGQRGGGTNITDAIRDARGELLGGAASNPGAAKALLLFTDGVANLETSALTHEANLFKAMPGKIFALGFGAANEAQLTSIASSPAETHVYMAPTIDELEGLAEEIAEEIQAPAATDVALTATVAAPFAVVPGTATASTGTAGDTAGGVAWSVPLLQTETQTLTFDVVHTGLANGSFDALSALGATYVDSEGKAAAASAASSTITVTGCNRAPVADAGPDQTIALSGSPLATATMDATGSSDPDGDPLEYSWASGATTVGTGATPTLSLGLGTHVLTLTVIDPGGLSDSDTVTVTVFDPTPPVVTPHVVGTLGDDSWYISDVAISWTVTDLESPISSSSGCGPAAQTTDTAGATFTCTATSAGGLADGSVTIKRDATDPTIAFAGNLSTYGVADTISITCTAADAMSGLASATCPEASGPAYDFVGTNTLEAIARDEAGNTASASTTFVVVVTAADICTLVRQYVDQHGVAHALCTQLGGPIRAFVNHVNAQRGKRLTDPEADLLIRLAVAL